ncbi:MAG TPA: UDP-N-acetylmuramate dehydrogenase [Vicinamibacterales bacterium]|nr:UDP-N-acetylmuramate dehydrogenase [Vicinamibacterales bacterium]
MRSSRVAAPRANVPLAALGTLGVGGTARWFLRAEHADDVAAARSWCEEQSTPWFVLGAGSNVVIADRGFDGLMLQIGMTGMTASRDGQEWLITAGAGESWDSLVQMAVDRGLAGVECLSGIPGTVGGTPIQNVGAYGQEVSSTIEQVTVYDCADHTMRSMRAAECGFSYRMSRFKAADEGRFVVCEVTLRLRPGPPTVTYADVAAFLRRSNASAATVEIVRDAVLTIRRSKGMVVEANDPDSRSVGSFFMNPVVTNADRERVASLAGERPPGFATIDGRVKIPAAWLIERSGFTKGYVDGAVGISTKHPLALINRGGATAADVLRLARAVKQGVGDRFGVWLRPEPIFVGFDADPDVDFLTKAPS